MAPDRDYVNVIESDRKRDRDLQLSVSVTQS